jgi:glycerol-3-phosphate dehydrogenase
MGHLRTDVLVIGGGATGTGVLRDLAMRGFKCILVERRDLAYGTTGRFHGLLHSGGRYVVNDPEAARECYEENQLLRRIMPQCLEDTGGFFVLTPQDNPAYVPQFIEGCRKAGIPLETVSISRMLKIEPLLNPKIQQCYRLPDASADSFLAAHLNAEAARHYGAQVLSYHEATSLTISHPNQAGSPVVTGAMMRDLVKDEDVQVDCSLVVNASGPWAGKIAQMAGIPLEMVPGKGIMVAVNQRVVNTVINRCKLPGDGDVLVPAHTVAIIGTTDVRIADPDKLGIDPWEVRLMLEEGEKIIPAFRQLRVLRAWAGARPLVKGVNDSIDRDISRAYVLLDHAERDGVEGIVTITGGKWTTYRRMAQVTVNKVCEKLKVDRPCRTHLETLPPRPTAEKAYHHLGDRLEKVEKEGKYGQLICECELVTLKDVEQAIIEHHAATLDDIRRDTRLGMGPCQAAFCGFRSAGILHAIRHLPVEQTDVCLRDFLQERWKGNLPILWGQQLRQARFNELVYVDLLNADDLPGEPSSRLAADNYVQVEVTDPPFKAVVDKTRDTGQRNNTLAYSSDLLVIGGGYSGLFAAWQASLRGLSTHLITQGWGTPYWSSGCIDIIGYQPPAYSQIIASPADFLQHFTLSSSFHPYSIVGLPDLESAIHSFLAFAQEAGYPYQGSLERNILLPTALGTLRPSCLVPEMMVAGDAADHTPMLIVGFDRYNDFFPGFVADNLTTRGLLASEHSLGLKSLGERKIVTGLVLARCFDEPEFRQEVIEALKPRLGHAGRVGFPAVLGLTRPMQVRAHLEAELGLPVFEITTLPPSIPGIRLQNMLISAIEHFGNQVITGMQVNGWNGEATSITAVHFAAAARQTTHLAKNYILATGGFLGGGITEINNGYAQETIFNLPIHFPANKQSWLNSRFLDGGGHPIFSTGIQVDDIFRPLGVSNQVSFDNLYAIGNVLGGCDPVRERSLEGIALATAYFIVSMLAGAKT